MSMCARCGKQIQYTVAYLRGRGNNKYHLACAEIIKEEMRGLEQ